MNEQFVKSLDIHVLPPAEQDPQPDPPFQKWNDSAQRASAEFYRSDRADFLVRFPSVADFRISGTGEVCCVPVPGSGDAWRSVFEQQVQPLLLSMRGEHVFHGAAVVVDGWAIGFLGPSGQGKSTLTAALARRGCAFLSDDCLHLCIEHEGIWVQPHAAYVRLWTDSAEFLGRGDVTIVPGSPKPRLMAGDAFPYKDRPARLTHVYVLGDSMGDLPAIEAMLPSRQLMAWTANAFVLDLRNGQVLRRNMEVAANLVQEVRMRRLAYQRRYDVLESVVEAILEDVAGRNG